METVLYQHGFTGGLQPSGFYGNGCCKVRGVVGATQVSFYCKIKFLWKVSMSVAMIA